MTERILCVDDDPCILQGYQRTLRKRFWIEPALGGEEAMEAVLHQGPYAVVVADMRMPGMSGVELLARIEEVAPSTVRMMLTGNADQQTAINAVNEGHIFRFLIKPCPAETFATALDAALGQHRLITAERELLSNTLRGSIKLLTEILALVNPTAFGRTARIRALVGQICGELKLERAWLIEIAAMLSQIGCVTLPQETLDKVYKGQRLTPAELTAWDQHPEIARGLIANIPRLEEAAEIVAYQECPYKGSGNSDKARRGSEIPLGSRILKVAIDWDTLTSGTIGADLAMAEMNERHNRYDPNILEALRRVLNLITARVIRRVRIRELFDGAILAEDVTSINGTCLCSRGQEVTPSVRLRLRNYAANVGIRSPVRVLVPVEMADRFSDDLLTDDFADESARPRAID